MFRSIFTKYITTFMLIIIVSFVMLASIISTMIVNYYTGTSEEQLSSAANSISYLIQKRLADSGSDTLRDYVISNSAEVGAYFSALTQNYNDMSIFLTDSEGNILASMAFTDSSFGSQKLSSEIMTEVKNGSYREKGDLGGVLMVKRTVLGVPVESGDGSVIGAAFACTTERSLNTLMLTTVKAIIMTYLWVLLAALIAVYFISDRIISPLKDMGRAAKSFASGKFDVRVPVTGHDEISELAIAFNNMAGSLADLENMRSTFLSNVSHELKTPLTSISGYAEIMMNGLVKSEDMQGFSERIYKEASRMITLVGDIIKLSKLDEGSVELEKENVDLYQMTREIVSRLALQAEKRRIQVEVVGEHVECFGIRQILDEMIYNICENAIKYNKENGKVNIWVGNTLNGKKVIVQDTGIGIPKEHQDRIFECFYRVDKSHSRETGGTGLGLSIVKHGALLHNAEIHVESEEGKGTKMELIFHC